jgi:hypothetical protein
MKEVEKFFWYLTRDNLGKLVGCGSIIGLFLLGIALFGQKTKKDELKVVRGKFERISYESNFKGRQLDFLHLTEYSSKFQISYVPYDEDKFLELAHSGDSILIHIDNKDKELLKINESKIRCFSLYLNEEQFLDENRTVQYLTKMNNRLVTISTILLVTGLLFIGTRYKDWKAADKG